MIIDGLPEVYFQRSSDYQFHFQFAAERLSPFSGMDSDTFNNVSLYRGGQKIVLGAVLWAPDHNEFGIQFVGQDTYPREMSHFLYDTVVDRIAKPAGCEGFYMPTYEQAEAAQEEQTYLVAHGIEVSSPERGLAVVSVTPRAGHSDASYLSNQKRSKTPTLKALYFQLTYFLPLAFPPNCPSWQASSLLPRQPRILTLQSLRNPTASPSSTYANQTNSYAL